MSSRSVARRVLVVEDHPDIADVLAHIVALDGHTVAIAPNGRVALEKLGADDYDVILCDVNMPILDGPGLYEALERNRPDLLDRFVLVAELMLDPLAARVEDFVARTAVPIIGKPFNRVQLQRMIERVCAGRGEDVEAAESARDALRVPFTCPLCADEPGGGGVVTAELETSTPAVMIGSLAGCPHADAFGEIGPLSPSEERRLIGAALDAFEQERERRADGGDGRRCASL